MKRMRLTIAVLFIAAFAAGAAASLALRPRYEPPAEGGRDSWMARELDLTPQQQEQMHEIWAAVGRDSWRADSEKRRDLRRERDDAIRNLVPEDQQEALDQVYEHYSSQLAEMDSARRAAFEKAIEKTRAILSAEQREQYQQFMDRRRDRRPGSGGPGGGPGRGWSRGDEDGSPPPPHGERDNNNNNADRESEGSR